MIKIYDTPSIFNHLGVEKQQKMILTTILCYSVLIGSLAGCSLIKIKDAYKERLMIARAVKDDNERLIVDSG